MEKTFCRNNVSKLERLNTRVSKLLTVAVNEVLEVVRETVSEYQEKTARTQRENERLRLKLRDALEQLEKEREVSRLASISLSVNSLSTQTQQSPEGSDVSCLRQESPTAQTEDPALKAEDLTHAIEPETVCDLRVAVTLADMCNDSTTKETQNSTLSSDPSPIDSTSELSVVDIKTEYTLDHSSPQQQMSQVGIDDVAEGLSDPGSAQEPMGMSNYGVLYIQSNLSTPQRHMMTGRSTKLALEGSGSLQGPQMVEKHGCKVCGKTFSRVGNLRIHERCHTGEKPYCCPVCGRCFIQAGDLKKHKRVHTGEKPYYCLQCGKSFSRRENLKRHQKIHIGQSLHHQRLWKDPQ